MLRNNSSGFGEFFRYHGWLAPGVRLFRRIGFRAKALCIGLAFLLPLLMLLGIASSSARSKIETAQSEIAGVAYMKPLLELARAAQLRRTLVLAGPAEQGPMQDAVKAAFQAVAAQQQAQGAAFGTGEAFGALRQAHEALVAAPQAATADETFARHSAFIDTVLDLARGVSDGSQLVLDPELDTFHLMTMAVLRGPMQVENSARLRDMGALVLRTASLSRERRDLIVQWSSVWEHLERDVENAYRRGIGAVPGLAAGFDMPATDAAADALRKAVAGQVLAAQLGGDAQAYLAAGNAAVDKQHALVLAVLDRLGQRLQARVDGMVSTLSLQFGLSALGMALAGYLLLAFHKVMMGGLQEVSGHLHAISRGNLGTVPEPWGRDEAAQVMLALRAMQQSLRSVVATVLEGSARVKSTSQGISSATNDLSQRAEQSAASLQRTATSTEQIAATARHTADAVDSAMAIVRDNALAAARGGQVIARVVETMTGIRTASNRIGEIIAVIDGIAFQTNILALNAAVEAARAGEQGRGFAVVAAEVRSLARRSADAAKEIKTLITASIGQVETGNTIVAEAGATIADIVAKAKSIDTMMAQVSSATHEQTAGVGQVGSAVRDIDRATQQNAALVEQTAVATSALSDEAGRLQEAVSFFTVEKPHHRG